MPATKLANALFALAVGVVLGVTAWAVSERAGGLVREPGTVSRKAQEITTMARPDETAGATAADAESTGRTERMIESGELSDHPARFYRREGGTRNRRRGGRAR
jgi:hypothetical protein